MIGEYQNQNDSLNIAKTISWPGVYWRQGWKNALPGIKICTENVSSNCKDAKKVPRIFVTFSFEACKENPMFHCLFLLHQQPEHRRSFIMSVQFQISLERESTCYPFSQLNVIRSSIRPGSRSVSSRALCSLDIRTSIYCIVVLNKILTFHLMLHRYDYGESTDVMPWREMVYLL